MAPPRVRNPLLSWLWVTVLLLAAPTAAAQEETIQADDIPVSQDEAPVAQEEAPAAQEEEKIKVALREEVAQMEAVKVTTPKAAPAQAPGSSGASIYQKLENARSAGVDEKDLSAVAAQARMMASEELKQAAQATHHSSSRRLNTALANAESTGMSAADQSTHIMTAVESAARRLASALSSANTSSAANVEELSQALTHGRSVGLNQSVLDSAKNAYERLAQVALDRKDLNNAEILVKHAAAAEASIPPQLHEWAKMLNKLRDAQKVPEDQLDALLTMVNDAKRIGLPNSTDLAVVEAKVQAWSSSRLNGASATGSNLTESEFNALLQEVERARAAGISSSNLTSAREKVLSFSKSTLAQACGVQPNLYDSGRLKGAFQAAAQAGVPEAEIAAARKKVVDGIDKHMLSLMESNASSTRSREYLQEFSNAVMLASRFDVDEAHLTKARTYYAKQGEKALSENNLPYAIILMEFSAAVSVDFPVQLKNWVRMAEKLKTAEATPDEKLDLLPEYASMLAEAKAIGLPNSSDFSSVEKKVQGWAGMSLKEAMGKGGNSTTETNFNAVLHALKQAKSAGLPASSLAAAESLTASWATSELTRACTTKPYDASKIKAAFHSAEEAGVPAATRDRAFADITATAEHRLRAASNATRSNGTDFINELELSYWFASRFPVDESVMVHAASMFEEVGTKAIADKDFSYAELVADAAQRAGPAVSARVQVPARVHRQLREAESVPADLPALLDLIKTAKLHGMEKSRHLAAVEAQAKSMAAADLKAEL